MPAHPLSTPDATVDPSAVSALRVTGRPDDDELAAVLAVLRALAARPPAGPVPATARARPGWTRPARYTAPGAWLSSSAR
ncbi:acyl-CoA carboxylase epsilon subunit [Goodfellowiella coeruleoviolacea]|uniref:Acyl-CoA carboxylase epsilon subunit n=1 Tax=Goodfellowiella coeruleoviolacea TaxID=334858 RepID=A0AAE3GB02_9PSEU|nr:acyl-CoA carboxylase epsilon subunit [Goodfellowiella coeruleoviolacea]MCP2164100.1 Acyl-CoA carboxylase epsilon subunit [Goodfellowiella coeruleoviolacea]